MPSSGILYDQTHKVGSWMKRTRLSGGFPGAASACGKERRIWAQKGVSARVSPTSSPSAQSQQQLHAGRWPRSCELLNPSRRTPVSDVLGNSRLVWVGAVSTAERLWSEPPSSPAGEPHPLPAGLLLALHPARQPGRLARPGSQPPTTSPCCLLPGRRSGPGGVPPPPTPSGSSPPLRSASVPQLSAHRTPRPSPAPACSQVSRQ